MITPMVPRLYEAHSQTTPTAHPGQTKPIHWDLSDLHHTVSIEDTMPTLDTIKNEVHCFANQYRGRVAQLSAQALHEACVQYDAIRARLYKISQFAHLHYAVDLRNNDVLNFVATLDEFASQQTNRLLFFFLEIGSVDDATKTQWLAQSDTQPYTYKWSQAIAKNRYRLSEAEEQIIILKDLNGVDAIRKLYGEHTAQYQFRVVVDGHEKSLNGSECRALRYHPDPDVRSRAMTTFFERYQADSHIMTNVFNAVVKDYTVERIQRGYDNAIDVMNTHNDLPNQLVHMLHDITTASNTTVQDYYRIKKDLISLNDFTLSDIYAPITANQPDISWPEAQDIVCDSFTQFDPEFGDMARDMFQRQRVDVFPSPVKRGGAFCSSSSPDVRPYVMLNYLGKPRDVATVAHELGHAIHAYMSAKQPLMNYHAILPVCETASVFCEMIVMDALKKKATTTQQKMGLLTTKLEDIFATSHRQNMFSRFEQYMHHHMATKRLSSDELCAAYTAELTTMFGDAVRIPESYQWEWATIPHMLDVPFYVYSYNFGNLLVIALYQLYLEQGAAFIPVLKRLLARGSSMSPVAMFAAEGIDILNESFWQKSLDYMANLVTELRGMVAAQ